MINGYKPYSWITPYELKGQLRQTGIEFVNFVRNKVRDSDDFNRSDWVN